MSGREGGSRGDVRRLREGEYEYNVGRLYWETNPKLCMSMHTHLHIVDAQKPISLNVITSVPLPHRLQFSDLIGPTNWPSAHLM